MHSLCRHRFGPLLAAIAFAALALLVFGQHMQAAEGPDSLNPLFEALPAGHFAEVPGWERIRESGLPFSRTKGVFSGTSLEGKPVGTVFHMVSPGYGGPVQLLVSFNPDGQTMKVDVFKHQETDCHIQAMKKGGFLTQFEGISLREKLRLLIGMKASEPGDVQAMTGGTVTSKAVFDAVAEARVAYHELYEDETD